MKLNTEVPSVAAQLKQLVAVILKRGGFGGRVDTHSPVRHSFASPHATPSATASWRQPASAAQESVVHGFASSQLGAAPGVHAPL